MKSTILACLLALAPVAIAETAAKSGDNSFSSKSHHAMTAMDQKMRDMKMSGDAGTDFAAMMIPHHQAAIDMAKAYLESGKDSDLRRMAEKMVSDQEKEVKQLQAWLDKNGKKSAQTH